MSSKLTLDHVQRVRSLYKAILKLHRGLPADLRSLGDEYVRDEFRRHRDADAAFVPTFMTEWTNYAITLNAQLRAQLRRPDDALFGTQLSEAQYGALSDEQIAQLYELFQETQKLRDPSDPLGLKTAPPS